MQANALGSGTADTLAVWLALIRVTECGPSPVKSKEVVEVYSPVIDPLSIMLRTVARAPPGSSDCPPPVMGTVAPITSGDNSMEWTPNAAVAIAGPVPAPRISQLDQTKWQTQCYKLSKSNAVDGRQIRKPKLSPIMSIP